MTLTQKQPNDDFNHNLTDLNYLSGRIMAWVARTRSLDLYTDSSGGDLTPKTDPPPRRDTRRGWERPVQHPHPSQKTGEASGLLKAPEDPAASAEPTADLDWYMPSSHSETPLPGIC